MRSKGLGFALVIVAVVSLLRVNANAEALYRSEVKERTYGGKSLMMKVEEQSREELTSTVKVTFQLGSSVQSVLYIAKSLSEIGIAREAKYFVVLKEWTEDDGSLILKVGFAQEPVKNASTYFGEPVVAPSKHLPQFLSVKAVHDLLNP